MLKTKHIGVNYSYFSPTGEEPAFSWSPCESCNDTLDGMRYEITCREGFCNPQGEIVEFLVCIDCFFELFL